MDISTLTDLGENWTKTEYGEIPPSGDFVVHGHEASVNVRLFGEWATRLTPDPFVVVEKCVGGDGGGRGK